MLDWNDSDIIPGDVFTNGRQLDPTLAHNPCIYHHNGTVLLVYTTYMDWLGCPKGLDCFWALKTGCFKGPLRGRGSPLEGPGVCIGGVMTLRVRYKSLGTPSRFESNESNTRVFLSFGELLAALGWVENGFRWLQELIKCGLTSRNK